MKEYVDLRFSDSTLDKETLMFKLGAILYPGALRETETFDDLMKKDPVDAESQIDYFMILIRKFTLNRLNESFTDSYLAFIFTYYLNNLEGRTKLTENSKLC